MGIPEMLAQSKDSGGMEGFFNSPIAMILMPRTAARFQEAKKDQMLLEQYNRKVQLAGKFADQIEQTDPMAAAMIRADPSTMDNVFSAYYGAQKAEKLAKQGFEYDIRKQQNQADLSLKTEEAKKYLPGEAGDWQKSMAQKLVETVQPSGVMANPSVQGPRPDGELQQGQTTEDINPHMATVALGQDFGLPDLTEGNMLRIMKDPKAPDELQDNRRSELELGSKTVKVVENGKVVEKALNTKTGVYDRVVGEVPKSAEELKLGSQTINKLDSDGVVRTYAFVPGSGYTKSEGLTPPPADGNLGKHVEVFDPKDKKTYIMGWDPATQGYNKKIGLAEPKSGTPMYAADGVTITGYMGGAGPKGPTEAQQKGISLYEGAKDQYKIATDNFDSLLLPRNSAAASMGNVGRAAMTEEGQIAYDAVKQVAQNYIYALSGQQAPDSEVERIMGLVMPSIQDYPGAKKNKKILLHSMMRAIKARLPDKYEDDKLNAPEWDGKTTVPLPTPDAPPMPKAFSDKGYTQEQWNSLDPSDWDAFGEENK